jgi:NADP-dependent 3-hydroxy acid dehydrogenase YdfG
VEVLRSGMAKAHHTKRASYELAAHRACVSFRTRHPLINNAGVFIAKPFTDDTLDDYATAIAVNPAGFFHITQRAIR